MVADLAHLIAACVWAGSLLLIAFVLTERRTGTSRRDLLRPVARRFGLLAGASVAVLVVTGLYAAGKQVASVGDLQTTGYGKVLIAKSALVGVALLAGASAAVSLRRAPDRLVRRRWGSGVRPGRLGPIGLTRLVVIEASLVAVVLLLTGVLTSTAPTPRVDPGSGEAMEARSELIDDVVVTVAVKPNRPGDNIYVVHASSIVRPTPAPIERVLLRFDLDNGDFGTETVVLDELEPGRFQAGGDQLRLDGSWTVEAVVRRSGLPDVVAPFDWRLSTGAVAAGSDSGRPLEPILNAVALTLVTAIAVTALTAFVLRHRPIPVPSDRPVDLVGTEAA